MKNSGMKTISTVSIFNHYFEVCLFPTEISMNDENNATLIAKICKYPEK